MMIDASPPDELPAMPECSPPEGSSAAIRGDALAHQHVVGRRRLRSPVEGDAFAPQQTLLGAIRRTPAYESISQRHYASPSVTTAATMPGRFV